ncbi:MAG: SufD family Fe-S cluster assembly protein, partial [Ktedonobacteraceae bacterium]|nr:SufD family Fe-S cluster assembly protein [Ktedonobacteraceae bacterium]
MLSAMATGFSRGAVEELSRQKGEPAWMLQKRLHAWEVYETTPTPLGRRGDLGTLRAISNFKFQQLTPFVPAYKGEKLSAAIEESLHGSLVNAQAGLIVQHNGSVIHTQLREELEQQGVILTDLDTAVREYPELVQKYFMTECVPVESNKYTALHAAFWSSGFFLYVPKSVEIENPILAQVWIDAAMAATFSHTLVVADEMSSVRFVEEYTSDVAQERLALLDDVVEVYAQAESRVEFSNLQNLGQNIWNITHKNAVYGKDGSVT